MPDPSLRSLCVNPIRKGLPHGDRKDHKEADRPTDRRVYPIIQFQIGLSDLCVKSTNQHRHTQMQFQRFSKSIGQVPEVTDISMGPSVFSRTPIGNHLTIGPSHENR
jgi:hypothetical protein